MSARDDYPLQEAIATAVARAFRRRAKSLRNRAASGITVLGDGAPIVIVDSAARPLLNLAQSWDEIASDLESGAIK
jgi:hypothetical protein